MDLMQQKVNEKNMNILSYIAHYCQSTLERCLMEEGIINWKAKKEFLPMQPGDVYQTYADVSELEKDFGFRPSTPLEVGLRRFAKWYKEYYQVNCYNTVWK